MPHAARCSFRKKLPTDRLRPVRVAQGQRGPVRHVRDLCVGALMSAAVTEAPSPATVDQLIAYLEELGIDTSTVEHPAVFTVEEARRLRGNLPGAHSKSLFLRNKKGRMWLVVTLEDRDIDLKDLGDRLGAGRFSFGSADRLMRYLGVIPGAVTPFAAINDREKVVTIALDRELLDVEPLNFHPLDNTKTTAISADSLLRFLEATGHTPELLSF